MDDMVDFIVALFIVAAVFGLGTLVGHALTVPDTADAGVGRHWKCKYAYVALTHDVYRGKVCTVVSNKKGGDPK